MCNSIQAAIAYPICEMHCSLQSQNVYFKFRNVIPTSLNSETCGDSQNAFLHCGDVLGSMHVSVDTPMAANCSFVAAFSPCISVSLGLHLNVFGTASQCLWDCILMSLGLHLNVFGTASQCLWDCISMSLGLHLNVFGTASQCSWGLQVSAELHLNVLGDCRCLLNAWLH